MSAEFEQLVAQFEQFQSKIKNLDEQFANIGDMQAELGTLEARATSTDRSVTVVAGPGGSVKDIQFTEDALKQRPQALAATVMSTLQEAVADAARQQAGVVDQHMGAATGLNTTDQVLETQAEVLGTTVQELRERMEQGSPPPRQTPEDERHEDYSQQSFLQADDQPTQPPPPSGGDGSAGDDFLRNLFNDDEDHR